MRKTESYLTGTSKYNVVAKDHNFAVNLDKMKRVAGNAVTFELRRPSKAQKLIKLLSALDGMVVSFDEFSLKELLDIAEQLTVKQIIHLRSMIDGHDELRANRLVQERC